MICTQVKWHFQVLIFEKISWRFPFSLKWGDKNFNIYRTPSVITVEANGLKAISALEEPQYKGQKLSNADKTY